MKCNIEIIDEVLSPGGIFIASIIFMFFSAAIVQIKHGNHMHSEIAKGSTLHCEKIGLHGVVISNEVLTNSMVLIDSEQQFVSKDSGVAYPPYNCNLIDTDSKLKS